MSLVFCDGFDDGLTIQKWNAGFGGGCSTVSGGRTGNRLRAVDNNGFIKHKVDAADEHATMTVGCALNQDTWAFNNSNSTSGQITLTSDSAATLHITVLLTGSTTSPVINVYRGGTNGTLLSSVAVSNWINAQWYYLEASAVLSDTVGSVVVKLNGTTINNITSVDTKNGGTKTVFDSFVLQAAHANGNGDSIYFDDVYMTNGAGSVNTGFLGDIAVETLYPSGDGSASQFTGSDGNSTNNYALVNEAGAPNTTTYTQDATVGQRDLYAYTDLIRTRGTVYRIQINCYVQASDNGAVSAKNVVKSGATVVSGAAAPVVTTYVPVLSLQETDPNTATAWTIAGVNAAEIGVEVA